MHSLEYRVGEERTNGWHK